MTLGYANPSFADKPDPNHDHGGAAFDVVITGGLGLLAGRSAVDEMGKKINPWLQGFGGKNSIGLNDASGLDVGSLAGVGMLIPNDDSTVLHPLCFPGDYMPPPHDSPYELHQTLIKPGKKGRAEANFWFHGKTFLRDERVLYVLKLFGEFANGGDWPGAQTLDMTTWELKVENEGKTIKEISCQGDGSGVVTIEVTVTQ